MLISKWYLERVVEKKWLYKKCVWYLQSPPTRYLWGSGKPCVAELTWIEGRGLRDGMREETRRVWERCSRCNFSEELSTFFKTLSPATLDSIEKIMVCHFKYVCSITVSGILKVFNILGMWTSESTSRKRDVKLNHTQTPREKVVTFI